MIINIYCSYDRELKVFDQPFFTNAGKADVKEVYRRQFFHEPKKAYDSNLDKKDLYWLGTFDEVKGEIASGREFLFDIRDVLPPNPNPVARDLTPAQLVNLLSDEIAKKVDLLAVGGKKDA